MNLLSLVHAISEDTLTLEQLGERITEAIDNDTSTPIDGWDMSGIVRMSEVNQPSDLSEIVQYVAITADEWGYAVNAKTQRGSVVAWRITLTVVSSNDEEQQVADEDADDDPRCVCGTYLSEHALCGCPEGFQTAKQWEAEREAIHTRASLEAVLDTYGYDEDDYSDIDNMDWD